MDLEAIFQTLIGKQVSAKTMPGNTIEVWLDVPPISNSAIVFGIDPPWRIVVSDRILATSAEIPWDREIGESDLDYQIRNEIARSVSDVLIGRSLTHASCSLDTGDLTLHFEGNMTLQCFAVWRDEPQWTLRLYAENRRLAPDVDEAI